MKELSFIQLIDKKNPFFEVFLHWQNDWWGAEFGWTPTQVRYFLEHTLEAKRVPQTQLALLDQQLIGCYQLLNHNLDSRPDLYPWFANAYIVPEFRGRGYFRQLMAHLPLVAKSLSLDKIYLHSRHQGLYEKFGWQLLEESTQYKADGVLRKIYVLEVKG